MCDDDIVNNLREIYNNANPQKLRELIEKHFIPSQDEKTMNAEIPTPVTLVNEMLDSISSDFWKTPHTVFEPCCGKGNFVLGIFDKFYNGLTELYPDKALRCHVILTECIYYADLTRLNVFVTTELLKCHVQHYCGTMNDTDKTDYIFNSHIGDTLQLDTKEQFDITQFDAVIGNPPYSTNPSKPDTKPLYNKFITQYIDSTVILLFVIPSRWFVGGKGLDTFRSDMMKRQDIPFIKHIDDSKIWFGNNIEIKGGVNYFLKDSSFSGKCKFNGIPYDLSKYDCIIKPCYHEIVDAVQNMESICKLYIGRCFGMETNDNRLQYRGDIKCYVSFLKSKDRYKFIDKFEFNEQNTFWKVITTEAAHKAFSGFGITFIGKPNEIHTGSYISFRVKSELEANSLKSYLDTAFVNHMLSIRKISQHINKSTCKWIPLVPFDRLWNDDKVCEYLQIDKSLFMK